MNATEIETTLVIAEDAPIGMQLWPTVSPKHAPNFTLAAVEVVTRKVRDASGTYDSSHVEWTYENGTTRLFSVGEKVACLFC